ncbi:MAG: hypothetical protein ABR544_08305, partial [Gammaproteobacteria bacterium]
MKKTIIAGLLLLASAGLPCQAEILALTGTAVLYDPVGSSIGLPTPVTGEYDTEQARIEIDPWLFLGSYMNSQVELLNPGVHNHPEAGSITVGAGQLGGQIQTSWAVSNLTTYQVWDVIEYAGGMSFRAVDSDGDGVPGHAMITGPFPGFSLVYEFDVGESAPGVEVSLHVPGGTVQECNAIGGKEVSLSASASLKGGAELSSIDWVINGEAVGSGPSIQPFLALGSHAVQVTATTTGGHYDTATTTVNVRDTVRPDLAISFRDTRTGQAVTSVDGTGVSFIEVHLDASDVCDPAVAVLGVAKPVHAIVGGEVIKIQGKKQAVNLPTTAIEVSATATDAS